MKRQIAGILALLLLILSLSLVSVSAASNFTVTVGSVTGQRGDEVVVPVTISGNTGFLSLGIEIGYNNQALKLVNAENKIQLSYLGAQNYSKNPYNMSWHEESDVLYNGVIAELTFEILDTEAGEYPVTVDFYKGRNGNYVDGVDLNYKEKDGTLEEFEPLNITYVNGKIKVIEPVTGVILDKDEAELYIGETVVLDATVQPENASNKAVTWKSSNEDVAKVDAEGKVTAVGKGDATITVETADGGHKATCEVTVLKHVDNVTLDKTDAKLYVGEDVKLNATVTPDDASDKAVTWKSSNENVAKVDAEGKVTAVGKGDATITVETADGGYKAACEVTVLKHVENVTLDKTEAELYVGETVALNAAVTPDDASDKAVTWKSSNEDVAKVDATGKVTAVGKGDATITVETIDGGYKATCEVIVLKHVTGITLDKDELELYTGDEEQLKITIIPDDASDKAVTWKSSNEDVAKVDAEGKVTAVGIGDATITVETIDGGYKATCEVTVLKRENVISAEAVTEGNDVVIDITLTGDSTAIGRVYVGLYNTKGYLCGFQSFDATANKKITFENAGAYEYGKIMWWDDQNKPMCAEKNF